MYNKIILILSGFVMGIIFTFLFLNKREDNKYIILKSDYKIEGAGNLNKGTILKIDEGMSEGFTRYILYLNLKGGNYQKYPKKEDFIIPYWLNEIEDTSVLGHQGGK